MENMMENQKVSSKNWGINMESILSLVLLVSMFLPLVTYTSNSFGKGATLSYSFLNAFPLLGTLEVFSYVVAVLCFINIGLQYFRRVPLLSHYVAILSLVVYVDFILQKIAMSEASSVKSGSVVLSFDIGFYVGFLFALALIVKAWVYMGKNYYRYTTSWHTVTFINICALLCIVAGEIGGLLMADLYVFSSAGLILLIAHLPAVIGFIARNSAARLRGEKLPTVISFVKNRRKLFAIAGGTLITLMLITALLGQESQKTTDMPFKGVWEESGEYNYGHLEIDLYEPSIVYRDKKCYGYYETEGGGQYIAKIKSIDGNVATVVAYDFFFKPDESEVIKIIYNKKDQSLSFKGSGRMFSQLVMVKK